MAIAFARTSIHTRSKGHSAIAGAAYRAGAKLFDVRTGETHDFRNRDDVQHSEIILPVDADELFLEREALWNAVEAAEKRKDAQVAKDVVLALPKELSLKHQIALAREFAHHYFVEHGLVVDMALHDHGDGNPHAHLYITTRRLLGKAFDIKKARDLNPVFASGKNGQGFIAEQDYWGKLWRDFQNHYFQEHAIDLVVDEEHLFAQRHEGRIQGKAGQNHYLKEENQFWQQAAVEVALQDTQKLVDALSSRYAVFSKLQVMNFLFRFHLSHDEFQSVFVKLMSHADIICLGVGHDGKLRYTTRENFSKETKLAEQAVSLSASYQFQVSGSVVKKILKAFSLSSEQMDAVKHITTGADIAAIVGRAGTGKSYLLKAANAIWQAQGHEVYGISLSGIAAKGLKDSSGIESSTIASFKRQLSSGHITLNQNAIVVMDEAGMTALDDMAMVINTIKQHNAKLVLVGDTNQLQPINAGAPFRAVLEHIGFVELSDIRRQDDLEDREASKQLAKGNFAAALNHYQQKGATHWHNTQKEAMQTVVDNWLQQRMQSNGSKALPNSIILAHRNIDIEQLNQLARTKLLIEFDLSL